MSKFNRIQDKWYSLEAIFADRGYPILSDHKKLLQLKNQHLDQIAYLIGNGPSVSYSDLNKLQNEVSFVCNRFYLAYDKTVFRPTYTISSDIQMIEDFGSDIVRNSQNTVFLCSEYRPSIDMEYHWLRLQNRPLKTFGERSLYYCIYHTAASLLSALQIGYFMGIRKFVLYGVDHSFKYIPITDRNATRSATGDGNHFIENYRSDLPWTPPDLDKIETSFKFFDELLRSENGWIKNATRGGALEILERVSFDSIVVDN